MPFEINPPLIAIHQIWLFWPRYSLIVVLRKCLGRIRCQKMLAGSRQIRWDQWSHPVIENFVKSHFNIT